MRERSGRVAHHLWWVSPVSYSLTARCHRSRIHPCTPRCTIARVAHPLGGFLSLLPISPAVPSAGWLPVRRRLRLAGQSIGKIRDRISTNSAPMPTIRLEAQSDSVLRCPISRLGCPCICASLRRIGMQAIRHILHRAYIAARANVHCSSHCDSRLIFTHLPTGPAGQPTMKGNTLRSALPGWVAHPLGGFLVVQLLIPLSSPSITRGTSDTPKYQL